MIDTAQILDDVQFASAMLEKKDLSKSDLVFSLRNLLKMKYYPVAVKFFFSKDELEIFKQSVEYKTALHSYTFCHFVAASRQRGDILLGNAEKTGCSNAKYVMGWKDLDDAEIKSHLKYTKSRAQAEKFLRTKKRLPCARKNKSCCANLEIRLRTSRNT